MGDLFINKKMITFIPFAQFHEFSVTESRCDLFLVKEEVVPNLDELIQVFLI